MALRGDDGEIRGGDFEGRRRKLHFVPLLYHNVNEITRFRAADRKYQNHIRAETAKWKQLTIRTCVKYRLKLLNAMTP